MVKSRSRNRRGRVARRPRMPLFYIVEDTALAVADTTSTVTLYQPPSSTTGLELPSRFRLKSGTVQVSGGATANSVLAVIRRVPAGYTAPGITVTNGIGSLIDAPDILAYGLVHAFSANDPMMRIDLNMLRRTFVVYPGDLICLQVVANANSTNQIYNALIEYDVSAS